MSELYDGAAALIWRHTGADRVGGAQSEANACLGGNRSVSDIAAFTINRRAALRGIRVSRAVGPESGNGALRATNDNTVQYTPPLQRAGTATTVANGDTKQVSGA